MKLINKVALITAAGGAIGGAQARLFSAEGAKVVVADINYISAKKVSDQIINDKGEAIPIELNVKDSNSWKNCIKKVIDKFGTINILSNNAGANFRVDFEDQSESQFREIIDVGLIGSFLGIKHTIPFMKKNSKGVILNLGSLASIRPQGGSPGYASQKMGMMGLTRSAASSFAKYGIRCVLISPGHVDTPFIRDDNNYSPNGWETSIENPENYNKRLNDTPLGRLQTAEDIAKTFLFVASDDASMITGSMVTVDGGAAI